ncbi:N-acyl-D-amino-acid deacylase family protein [Gulosibacter hominis]|uniref:N-acyl-D-amino-acid deacylase family protein n=1 Tax=Gulosibacter hominis TaxID=2770504 RepID=UPI0019182402|nr:D-aminoacylase [Gulosibacter hominis]
MAIQLSITNARIIDGTGAPAFTGWVTIEDGVITAVTPETTASDVSPLPNSIDARNAVVAPGFIDVHSHADISPLLQEDDITKILQGVTTEVVGNCGSTVAPINPDRADSLKSTIGKSHNVPHYDWVTFAEYLDVLDGHGYVTNMCPLVGHGALRAAAMGVRAEAPSAKEMLHMQELLSEALDAGAFGLSLGLIYPPGLYSEEGELAALAQILGAKHTLACHMRNESNSLHEAIDEVCSVAERSGANLQISHLKLSGSNNWGKAEEALALIEAYRSRGVNAHIDVYPYMAASTKLSACLPPWALADGAAETISRLRSPESAARIRADLESTEIPDWDSAYHNAGPEGIRVASSKTERFNGMNLVEIAQQFDIDPIDALFKVLIEEELAVIMLEFSMEEGDMVKFLRADYAMVGSDGNSASLGGLPHPRLTGTYPTVLGKYVREQGAMTLEEAVHKMTGLPAAKFGVPARGFIKPGAVADLVCFDPDSVRSGSDYDHPLGEPVGINWVMQSGRIVVQQGKWCNERNGVRLMPA